VVKGRSFTAPSLTSRCPGTGFPQDSASSSTKGRGQIIEVPKELFQKSKSEIGLQDEKSPVLGDLGGFQFAREMPFVRK